MQFKEHQSSYSYPKSSFSSKCHLWTAPQSQCSIAAEFQIRFLKESPSAKLVIASYVRVNCVNAHLLLCTWLFNFPKDSVFSLNLAISHKKYYDYYSRKVTINLFFLQKKQKRSCTYVYKYPLLRF